MTVRRIEAVVFDLDGTLLDSLADLGESMNAVLESLRFPTHPIDTYKHFVGDGITELARRALPKDHHDEVTLKRCVSEMRRVYGSRWNRKTRPYTGVNEMLETIAGLSIPMAILSNKPDDLTGLVTSSLLPGGRFAVVRGARTETPRKPDPTAALEVARSLVVEPEGCLFVGDTKTDILTAQAAGMVAAGVLWGFRNAEELTAAGAQVLFEQPAQVGEWLLAACTRSMLR